MWSLLGHDPAAGVIVVTQGTGIEDPSRYCVCTLGIEYNSRDGGFFLLGACVYVFNTECNSLTGGSSMQCNVCMYSELCIPENTSPGQEDTFCIIPFHICSFFYNADWVFHICDAESFLPCPMEKHVFNLPVFFLHYSDARHCMTCYTTPA